MGSGEEDMRRVEEIVASGIALLNARLGTNDWSGMLDLDRLDVDDNRYCPLGQLEAHGLIPGDARWSTLPLWLQPQMPFQRACEKLGIDPLGSDAQDLGFCAPPAGPSGEHLTDAWKRALGRASKIDQ